MSTLVIDCNYIGHQARHSLSGLSHNELPTGIVFGFLSRILMLGLKFKTNDICFCWDSRKSIRRDIYPDYKKGRKTDLSEDELEALRVTHEQFKLLRRKILPALGFRNVFMKSGYEADDLIAKLVSNKYDAHFVIIASDKDLFQLLQWYNVEMYNPQKRLMMDSAWFKKEYRISPIEWSTVKQIAGCPTDSVSGIPGIGEKTAIKYLCGELKEASKAYQKICSDEAEAIYKRNAKLVFLPFKGTPELTRKPNRLKISKLKNVAEKYGMLSFLGPKLPDWKMFMKGNFDIEDVQPTVRRRRSKKNEKNKDKQT